VHVLVLLAAGFALCLGESINLTWLDIYFRDNKRRALEPSIV
jgi:hypothetical protein